MPILTPPPAPAEATPPAAPAAPPVPEATPLAVEAAEDGLPLLRRPRVVTPTPLRTREAAERVPMCGVPNIELRAARGPSEPDDPAPIPTPIPIPMPIEDDEPAAAAAAAEGRLLRREAPWLAGVMPGGPGDCRG